MKPMSSTMKAARAIVCMLDDGVHSMHEFDFLKECRRRGLPEPRRQRARKDSTGRTRYTDFEFEVNGRALVVEIDGVGHLDADVHIDDQWRANEMVMQDAKVLRIPGLALRIHPEPFFVQLERTLDAMRRAGR